MRQSCFGNGHGCDFRFICALRFTHDIWQQISKSIRLQQITKLDLSANRLTNEWWADHHRFLASDSVISVNLQTNKLGGSTDLPFFSLVLTWENLEQINLGSNQFVESSFAQDSPSPLRLRHVDIHRNPLSTEGLARCLTAGELRQSLEHLNVSGCQISSLQSLAEADGCPKLAELIVRNNDITTKDWDALLGADSALVDRLQILDTRNNPGTLPNRGI